MKLLSKLKRHVAIGMSTVLVLGMPIVTRANDYSNHWAKDPIKQWTYYGVIAGYEDGSFKPNNHMTRAEFASVFSNVFKLEEISEAIEFNDVHPNAWYAQSIKRVASAGIMQGASGKFNPNAPITRQEVAVAMANAYGITAKGDKVVSFIDANNIASWAAAAVESLASYGYINGRENGKFDESAHITRAEVIQMLDNITALYINAAGTYTDDVDGNVVIASKGVILKDMVIKGNLYLAQGMTQADITLENVKIVGNVFDAKGNKFEQVTSIIVDDVEVLGKGIEVKDDQINIDLNTLKASCENIYSLSVKVANLKPRTEMKFTTQIGARLVNTSRMLSEAKELKYIVANETSTLSSNYNAIQKALKQVGLLETTTNVAKKLGYGSLQELIGQRDALNVSNLQADLDKLIDLYNNEDADTVKMVNYLNTKGIKINNSTVTYGVKVEADQLASKNYTVNIKF